MSRSSKLLLLEEHIGLLVRHFGIRRVRAVVAKFPIEGDEEARTPSHRAVSSEQKQPRRTVAYELEFIRDSDPEKHRLLSEFLSRLKNRDILPESQDIRHFAQMVGLKDIRGKSRKDMIPTLMRSLLSRATDNLRIDIEHAEDISQQQRQEGYSVLTDKLLGRR
jgi:hypothetical protein